MNYRFTHSAKRGKFVAEFWIPVCFLVALTIFYIAYPAALQRATALAAAPFLEAKSSAVRMAEEFYFFFVSKRQLMLNARELSAKLSRTEALLLDREILLSENRILKEQLGSGVEGQKARRVAAVLATPPKSPYDTAVISIGSEDGVRMGDLALFGSVALGSVSAVFSHTSLVAFFSTAGVKTDVVILHGNATIPVEAEGRGGGEFRAVLPKGVPVAAGDYVTMPGFNPAVLAVVAAVEANEADSFQIVRFRNPISLESLRLLEIQEVDEVARREESGSGKAALPQ